MTKLCLLPLNVFRGQVFLIICLLVLSCNEDEDRFEVINKLRGVGIRADKPVVSGASTGKTRFAVISCQHDSALPDGDLPRRPPALLL